MNPSKKSPNNLRVLVIEDSPDILFVLKTELEFMGYAVEGATDGASGLQAAAQMEPHVIVSDIGMPGMDGFEFVRRLKRTAMGKIPVIAMTGYTRDQDVKQALASGFAAHLPKPIDPSDLNRLIQDLIRAKRSK